MHMHELLLRHGDIDERITGRGQLTAPGAGNHKQVGIANTREQIRSGCQPQVAHVVQMALQIGLGNRLK
jgi:hypothetical protein